MLQINFLVTALAALVPLIVGSIWYNPKVFGSNWMEGRDMARLEGQKPKIALVFLLTYILSFMLALAINMIVIHQFHVYSIFANDPGMRDPNSDTYKYVADFMSKYGRNFRTFKHGAFHGTLSGLFVITPVIGIISLFERRSFKYFAIHSIYWILCLALMGGIICAYT